MTARSLEQAPRWADWVTHERRNWIGAAILCGLFGFSLGNGHTTQGAIQHVSEQLGQKQAEVHKLNTVVIPQLKAATHCESARGDKAAAVAHQAIQSATIDAVPIPSPNAVPRDNCPHVKP